MKTLSLRFGENFAPECGTIKAHKAVIDKYGFVWYGKLGNPISDRVVNIVFTSKNPKILLIKSGTSERYWASISAIQRKMPDLKYIPDYYVDLAPKIKCWIKINKIKPAERDVISKCTVVSSGIALQAASRGSMNPCILVDYRED